MPVLNSVINGDNITEQRGNKFSEKARDRVSIIEGLCTKTNKNYAYQSSFQHVQYTERKTRTDKIELSQDSVARLTCALPLNLSKSMTHDLDLKVAQVGCDGTA